MNELISILPEILLLTMLTSAFAILCLTLHKVFEQMQLFRGKLAVLMSGLVAALAVTSTAMLLVVPNSAAETSHTRNISVNYSLLPALAVAGTAILLQLLAIAATTSTNERNKASTAEPTRQPANPKSPGRPKKEEPAEAQSKAAAKTTARGSTPNKLASDTADGL
jgi:hypothetical protein